MADAIRRKHATIVDVAKAADVSVSTAARVLRGSEYRVAPVLQQRVRAAAENLGYVPNLMARNLRGGEHKFLGLIVGNMVDPYFGEIAESATEQARASSLLAIVSNMQRDPQLEIELCRQLWEQRVSGLILAGGGFDQWTYRDQLRDVTDRMTRSGTVVVSLAPRELDVPTFSVDNHAVGRSLAGYVISRGHREIGLLFGPPKSQLTQQRLRGVKDVLAECGMTAPVLHSDYGVRSGGEMLRSLLESKPKLTAVITSADSLALGVMHALQESGRDVPGDVSVVGIGNTVFARMAIPRLTTVDVSVGECGRAAVAYIAARLSEIEAEVPSPLPIALVEGASVSVIGE